MNDAQVTDDEPGGIERQPAIRAARTIVNRRVVVLQVAGDVERQPVLAVLQRVHDPDDASADVLVHAAPPIRARRTTSSSCGSSSDDEGGPRRLCVRLGAGVAGMRGCILRSWRRSSGGSVLAVERGRGRREAPAVGWSASSFSPRAKAYGTPVGEIVPIGPVRLLTGPGPAYCQLRCAHGFAFPVSLDHAVLDRLSQRWFPGQESD